MTAAPTANITDRWREIAARADAFFAARHARFGALMQCASGCSGCCQRDLSVLLVEAIAVAAAVAALPDQERHRVAEAASTDGPPCAFLHDDRCAIYDARPLVCRTHGLPIREDDTVGVCDLNFVDEVPDDAVLNGGILTAWITMADVLARQSLTLDHAVRVPLRDLARDGAAALPPVARASSLASGSTDAP